ncbi:lasso peptide biosynthesis PqqD family chaperone [Streptomyces sp. NPDC101152]|uniref:lasso peptide biosynthesis PqqD family chaperone n=1 Tax=Streptomyces sp. NPDC101152 TaxID=3366116 RepID=UPI00380E372C
MTLTLKPEITTTEVEDGLILLDERAGRYWQLNRSGAEALRLLLDGNTAEDTAVRLTERHPEAAERAVRDVEELVGLLTRARLVVYA